MANYIADSTVTFIQDAAQLCSSAVSAARNDSRSNTIHFLRQAAEVIATALADFDPSLLHSVRVIPSDVEPTAVEHACPEADPPTTVEAVDRRRLLELAATAVGTDRQRQYGETHDHFLRVAELWSGILGITVTSERVALCQIALKLSRLAYNPSHLDSWVDLAGYAAIGAELGTQPIIDAPKMSGVVNTTNGAVA